MVKLQSLKRLIHLRFSVASLPIRILAIGSFLSLLTCSNQVNDELLIDPTLELDVKL